MSQVLGFQFEPRKKTKNYDSDSSWTTYEDSDGDGDNEGRAERKLMAVDEWCMCGKCFLMSLENECMCCRELEVAQITEIGGMVKTFYGNFFFHS